jgi:dihydrofolate synthase / folylpolyglutamate synthase
MFSDFSNYAEALDWLFKQTRAGKPRDPERMRKLMRALALEEPPQSFHVVGTTGKGTVSAMIDAACTAAGLKSGLFISPHVEDFRERIAIGGTQVSEAEVLDFVRKLAPLGLEAAFFELAFALALERFARENVEVAAVEAGVGARRDATIVLDRVLCTVITNVGEDHLETLGPTLKDIARDKAGAIRPGVPVVTGAEGEALEVVREVAEARGSPLYIDAPDHPLFHVSLEADAIRRGNARLAAAALRVSGLGMSEEAIQRGLNVPALPARRERFRLAGKTVILDGAHNSSAARALLATLAEPFVLVFGALARKSGEATLRELEPYALKTFITDVEGAATTLQGSERIYVPEPLPALEQALESAPEGIPVVIAGSFYLAGRLRPLLRARQQNLRDVA